MAVGEEYNRRVAKFIGSRGLFGPYRMSWQSQIALVLIGIYHLEHA